LPIGYIVLNNCGWQSIKNLQLSAYGEDRVINTKFLDLKQDFYTPNFADVARGFGARGWRTDQPQEVGRFVREALDCGSPSLVEVLTSRELPMGGLSKFAWWDVPVPAYLTKLREEYEEARRKEKV